MKNLVLRSVSGFIYITLVIVSILLGKYYFLALLFIFNGLALFEFYALYKTKNNDISPFAGILTGSIVYLIIILSKNTLIQENTMLLLPLLPVIFYIIELFRKNNNPLPSLAKIMFGIIYITLPLVLLGFLAAYQQSIGREVSIIIPGIFILIWTFDTSAYLIGIAIGKHKLMKAISPKKSWEGLIGGIIISAVVAYFLRL